jgi:hypothetical protein
MNGRAEMAIRRGFAFSRPVSPELWLFSPRRQAEIDVRSIEFAA